MQEKKDKGEGQLQYEIKLYQSFQGISKQVYTQLASPNYTTMAIKEINYLW